MTTSFAEYTFTLTTPYIIANGDRIMVEYNGPAAVDMELWSADKFDGTNTRRVRYTTWSSSNTTQDVTGSMSGFGGGGSDTTPPSQVTNLTVAAGSPSSTVLNLSWTANPALDGVDHYNVYRGTTAGFPVTPGTVLLP